MTNLDQTKGASMLQSKDHGDLLDIIDDLRSQGIGQYVDLPQMIVCGDQSSGKSSVLEAVSGIRFPRKDNLCTRFATEVILRRVPDQSTSVSIMPANDRSAEDKLRLSSFQRHDVQFDEFELLVEEAKVVMGLEADSRAFSNDILRVEVSGPSQPHLTMVDLPGLFQAGNKAQSDEDGAAVRSLVLSYMEKPRSIILAVVSAKNDFANQIVTRYARDLDPHGHRTLGIITKPDTLHAGSDSERSFVELAENRDVFFRLGWHVLRNRDYDTRHVSDDERNAAERDFFSRGLWASLPTSQVGITSLRPRLSALLRDQILAEVPHLIDDAARGVRECQNVLKKLGASRGSLQEQRLYLLGISQTFTSLCKSAIDGIYNDAFFGSARTDLGYKRRLRAVTQNTLLDFAQTMREFGHAKHITSHVTRKKRAAEPRLITREEFVLEVLSLMRRSRGSELPGTYNPQIIGDLFYDQSKPWQSLVDQRRDMIWEATMLGLDLILDHATDDVTASRLRQHIINPAMDVIKTKLHETIIEVLTPHLRGHPITYNHYLTENIQKLREEQYKKRLIKRLDDFFGTNHEKGQTYCNEKSFDVVNLLKSLTHNTVGDMDQYACGEAIDCMMAYYKVAMKTLIDDFSVLAVERCLLQKLPDVFSPKVVIGLNESTISEVAAETEESQHARQRATEKLKVLQTALLLLRRLQRAQSTALVLEADLVDKESFHEDHEDSSETRSLLDVAMENYSSEVELENHTTAEEAAPEKVLADDDLDVVLELSLPARPNLFSKKKNRTKKDSSWMH